MPRMRNLARGAFFLSGIAGLTFEIIWARHLGLALGATTLAVATTTAAYMGGLAFGSGVGGRIADRLRRPLSVYGLMELLIGLMGLGVPWLCRHIPLVDAWLFADLESGFARALVRFVVAFLVLILPTFAMGTTLPILARVVTQRVDNVGQQVGLLYALNIAGATVGAALCGFVWIPAWGLSATNYIAVGIDVVLGLLALGFGTLLAPLAVTPPVPNTPRPSLWRSGGATLVTLLAVTGAAAMALQVLWTRALGTALGPSTYAFSAIVCAYLAGLAIGGFVAARVADKVTASRLALLGTLVVTAACTLIGITMIDDLPRLLHNIVLDRNLTMEGLIRSEFLLAALSVLPATIGMGAIFPLTLAAVSGSDTQLGAAVGRAYAINTLGAIFGCFAGVFILLPLVGVEWGMRLAALGYVGLALLLSFHLEPSAQGAPRRILTGLALVVGIATVAWPTWDIAQWTSGMFRLSMTRTYFPTDKIELSKVIYHHDGLASTVTVEEDEGVRWIKVNGKIDGSSHGDMPTQILSGILPMLLHPNPQEIAVIGCGSCVTVGAALQANPNHITLIELERRVVEAAHMFSDVNHAPWSDPRVSIVEDDGRNFMSRGHTMFDVIISEPSNPWMTGAASLFTEEFFTLAHSRLKNDGMFVQWLQVYELAPERIASVLKTFHAVFPNVLVFSAHTESNDLLLVGSNTPVTLDMPLLAQRFVQTQAELTRAELQNPDDLLALLLFTDKDIDTLAQGVPINTDDNAFLEFGAPRDLLAFAEEDPSLPLLEQVAGRRSEAVHRALSPKSPPWPTVAAGLAGGYLRQGMLVDAQAAAAVVRQDSADVSPADLDRVRQVEDVAQLLDGDDRERVVDAALVSDDAAYGQAARLLADGDDEEALSYLQHRPTLNQKDGAHQFLYGYLLYLNEDYSEARRQLQHARAAKGSESFRPAVTYYLARTAYGLGEYRRAATEMLRYRETLTEPLSVSKAED